MVKELKKGYLNDITGEFEEAKKYEIRYWKLEEFEKQFLSKEKTKLTGQLF